MRNRDRQTSVGEPVLKRYERIAFDKALLAPVDPLRPSRARAPLETPPASRPEEPSATAPLGTRASHPQTSTATEPDGVPLASRQPSAAFICPGHPLLDAVLDLTLERGRGLLQRGVVLVDERDPGVGIRVLFTLEHAIRDGSRLPNGEDRTISRRLLYVELDADGRASQLRRGAPACGRLAGASGAAHGPARPRNPGLGGAAIVPVGLIAAMTGRAVARGTVDTQTSAARARAIVMDVERRLGFEPVDRETEKLGYDVESRVPGTGKLASSR